MQSGTKYSKRDVIIINFPFSDLINSKKRPVLVLGEKEQDLIVCAITSNLSIKGIPITNFEQGSLPLESQIKYWQIHTITKNIILNKRAKITKETFNQVLIQITKLFSEQ